MSMDAGAEELVAMFSLDLSGSLTSITWES